MTAPYARDPMQKIEPVSHFISASDGLRLHAADWNPHDARGLPVVCLADFAGNSRDFIPLANRLVAGGRRVIALDCRGRGLSARDRNFRRYDLAVEQADILAVLAALEVGRAIFVGKAHGGLHVMALAAARPTLIGGAILNDCGPVVEAQGLMRMKLRLAGRPEPMNWDDAATLLRTTHGARFPALEPRDWAMLARARAREENERLFWDHDPALVRALDSIGPDTRSLDLWPQFEALATASVLVLRGALSDMLSPEVFAQMRSRTPNCQGLEVAGQGHAPLLHDAETLDAVTRFVARL